MKFLVVVSLVLNLGFAYGANIDRSKRDMSTDAQEIVAEIQENGIDSVASKINDFTRKYPELVENWNCPTPDKIQQIYQEAIESGDAFNIAMTSFGREVCKAGTRSKRDNIDRSKRDMSQDLRYIVRQIQENGIDAVESEIREFVRNYPEQAEKWNCPTSENRKKALESDEPYTIALIAFGDAVCEAVRHPDRDMQQDMLKIVAEIQENGIDSVASKINDFTRKYPELVENWNCPTPDKIQQIYQEAIESGDAFNIAMTSFGREVCKASTRSKRAIECPSLQDIIDALDSNNAVKAVANVVSRASCLIFRLE